MGKVMAQKDMVLQYIQRNGSITDMDAVYELGIHRLSARVADLRAEGHDIVTNWVSCKNRHGKMIRYGEYTLGKETK